VARVLKVPDRAALAQPYARLDLPRPSRRHQVNGRDSILGTHTLSSHANPASTVIAPAAELLTPEAAESFYGGVGGMAKLRQAQEQAYQAACEQ